MNQLVSTTRGWQVLRSLNLWDICPEVQSSFLLPLSFCFGHCTQSDHWQLQDLSQFLLLIAEVICGLPAELLTSELFVLFNLNKWSLRCILPFGHWTIYYKCYCYFFPFLLFPSTCSTEFGEKKLYDENDEKFSVVKASFISFFKTEQIRWMEKGIWINWYVANIQLSPWRLEWRSCVHDMRKQ